MGDTLLGSALRCGQSRKNLGRDVVVDGIPLHGFEAGAGDHLDDLLIGHFDFAFVGAAMGEFAAQRVA